MEHIYVFPTINQRDGVCAQHHIKPTKNPTERCWERNGCNPRTADSRKEAAKAHNVGAPPGKPTKKSVTQLEIMFAQGAETAAIEAKTEKGSCCQVSEEWQFPSTTKQPKSSLQ
jgi:hypothetical protein